MRKAKLYWLFVAIVMGLLLFSAFYTAPQAGVSSGEALYTIYGDSPALRDAVKANGGRIVEDYGSYFLAVLPRVSAERLANYGIKAENCDWMNEVGVPNYPFNARDGQVNVPENLRNEDTHLYIVKFHGPPKSAWINEVQKYGEVIGYVPHNALVLKSDTDVSGMLSSYPFINYVGKYYAAYKVDERILQNPGEYEVKIVLTKDTSPIFLARRLQRMGFEAKWLEGPFNNYVKATLPYSMITTIAKMDGVIYVEKYEKMRLMNDIAHAILQDASTTTSVHTVWDQGLYGDGQIIGEADTGIDYDHTMFRDSTAPKFDDPKLYSLSNLPPPDTTHRKIVHYWTFVDDYDLASSGHGTHVAGSIAGNATPYSSADATYNGQAPSAKLSFVDIGGAGDSLSLPDDLNYLFSWHYNDGAYLASNSWGSSYNGYSTNAMQVDQFMWSHPDFLILFANGNDGPNTNTVGSPATAKNCISVGALGDDSGWGSETLEDIASFSSRGPTADGRLKPTIVSPGVAIDSADSDGDPTTNNGGTTSMQGTSMATPNAAGAIALIRQYFTDGYYPMGTSGTGISITPSGALLKAMAINSADQATGTGAANNPYNGMTFPNNDQGYGRLHLQNALYFSGDTRTLVFWDNGLDTSRGIATGETWERKIYVSSSTEDLKVTLVWTDYPALPAANPALINDLDLVVIAPDGTEYHGNVFSGTTIGSVYSTANPTSYDRLNPEELVWVNSPAVGTWTIRVVGYSVSVAQPFAVVATGGIDTTVGSIEFDHNIYGDSEIATITVYDTDATNSVTVTVTSTLTADSETVTLNQIATGVFRGTIQLTPTDAAGQLYVLDGDTIRATYGSAEATALVDARYPTISNIRVDALDTTATVYWDTDEPTNYTFNYGLTTSLGTLIKNPTDFINATHSVKLTGLQPNTTYHFQITAWDRVGHMVQTAVLNFTTAPRADVLIVDDDAFGSQWEQYLIGDLQAKGWTYSLWDYGSQGRPTSADMLQYKAVVWDTADGYPPLDDNDVLELETFLDNGGRLMMIGQDIGWAAYDTTNSPWASTTVQNFIENYLHATYNADSVGNAPINITGTAGDPVGNGIADDLVDNLGGFYPEDITNNGGVVAVSYNTAPAKDAVIRFDGTTGAGNNRTVYVPFAYQDFQSPSQRKNLAHQSVLWLIGTSAPPTGAVVYPNGGETLSGTVTIQWNAADDVAVSHTDVYYSPDGGLTWYYLGTTTGTTLSWDTTTVSNGNDYLIRIVVYDTDGLHILDASDSTFAVDNGIIPEFSDAFAAVLLLGLLFLLVRRNL